MGAHKILAQRFRQSSFLRHNAIFFVGSVGVGLLNYIYYPVLGRLLEPSAFGEVQAIVSLFLQLTIFLTVLSIVTVNIVANYTDKRQMQQVMFELEKTALLISICLLLASVLFGNVLQSFLQFESAAPFSLLALALVVSIPLTFRSSFVRGKHAFGRASVINIVAAGAKLALSVALVVVGLNTFGAIAGIVVAQVLAGVLAAIWARQLGLEKSTGSYMAPPKLSVIKTELPYATLVLVGSLVITLLYSIDIVVVKHLFDPHTAGLYAGIATVARTIFFLTASIVQVMLPLIKLEQTPQQNRRLFIKSLGLMLLVATPALALFALWPETVVGLLMGQNYLPYAELLPRLSLAIFIISVLSLIISYFTALRRYVVLILAIMVAVVACLLMLLHHDNLQAIVENLLYTSMMALCLVGIGVVYSNVKRKRREESKTYHNNRSGL